MKLPIEAVKAELLDQFRNHPNLVLVAEPGAGKTTQVPLWLLQETLLDGQKIILLEPRRIAARAAAQRMASLLGETLGQTVGLRMRAETKVSAKTRLEVVTEGVFSRMILDNAELPGVGAVLFDEFHERSLDADLGLALALDVQAALRPDLKLMVLSATIDAKAVSALMQDAPTITSKGRSFPIDFHYLPGKPRQRIAPQVVEAVKLAIKQDSGSLLVFLPGRSEIETTRRMLNDIYDRDDTILIAPLYAGLPQQAQIAALQPAPKGKRKIVLSTNLAQTSMTIEGVRIVVDGGLSRRPRFNPQTSVSRLETVSVSRAAADQRAGRAGRTEPGICYRLWPEQWMRTLEAQDRPEILEADLSRFALDLAEWGVNAPEQLAFLDYPAKGKFTAAQNQLRSFGALDKDGHVTDIGRKLQALPLDPHLGAMALSAAKQSTEALRSALLLAALLSDTQAQRELDLGVLYGQSRSRPEGMVRQSFERLCRHFSIPVKGPTWSREAVGPLLLIAFPMWVAINRGPGRFQLAAGQRVTCPAEHALAGEPFLVVTDMMGDAGNLRLLSASSLATDDYQAHAERHATSEEFLEFNEAEGRVKAEQIKRLGAIVLERKQVAKFDQSAAEDVFWQAVAARGLDLVPISQKTNALLDRLQFLHTAIGDPWPDMSRATLAETLESWLRPFVPGAVALKALSHTAIMDALKFRAPQIHDLDRLAPERFSLANGRTMTIDYSNENGPTLRARAQDFFGVNEHPVIAKNVPLIIDLLSPARRSIQITRNLPTFWTGSWRDVRADMRGRYPKHNWPENPSST
ncbi:ATP-dependent helicase HrpB [Pararhizobium sp. IMCC21322]|uniref:ATP-dependent helicase HrpB n=1 Tax=Pararhizobium sp. IMCC21322 TaxID=3067903 RepID=UPI002742789E|nr:ATP-dependent helicase HrpB [Pararhizobium sp. IMCC21322]